MAPRRTWLGSPSRKVPHARRVLVGGLGLGRLLLRATLDLLGPGGKVVVAEQLSVVDWNAAHVGELAGHPLEDPRVTVRVGDVRQRLGEAHETWA